MVCLHAKLWIPKGGRDCFCSLPVLSCSGLPDPWLNAEAGSPEIRAPQTSSSPPPASPWRYCSLPWAFGFSLSYACPLPGAVCLPFSENSTAGLNLQLLFELLHISFEIHQVLNATELRFVAQLQDLFWHFPRDDHIFASPLEDNLLQTNWKLTWATW